MRRFMTMSLHPISTALQQYSPETVFRVIQAPKICPSPTSWFYVNSTHFGRREAETQGQPLEFRLRN